MSTGDIKETTHRFPDVAEESHTMLSPTASSYENPVVLPAIKQINNRFANVADEPCTMLTPISGFRKKPLVSLEEATAPLSTIVPRIDTFVYVAKQRAVNPANNLTVDESAAIALYTMEWEPYTDSLYYILNDTLRTEDRQNLKPWFLYLKLILTALSRLPSLDTTIYRGVRSEIEQEDTKYHRGKSVVWWGFSSCSKDRDVSEKDQFIGETGRRTLFVINCKNGKDISKHSYYRKEEEVLLLPATQVRVINNEHKPHGVHVIHLEETEPSFILLESVSSPEEIIAFKNLPNLNKPVAPPLKSNKPAASPSHPNTPIVSPSSSIIGVPEPERYVNPKLIECTARCQPRSEVFLIGKRFNESDIEVIVERLIKEKQCRELFLRESGVTSQGAIAIAAGLRGNKTLERLFISHNMIGAQGAEALAQSLSGINNTTLKQLCLSYNGITDKGVAYIVDMLSTNKTLTHLWLSSNGITDTGLKRIAEVITNVNKTLQVLALEWNQFRDDSSANALVTMLQTNTSLKELCLNSCGLSKTSIKQLKAAAKKRKSFELTIH